MTRCNGSGSGIVLAAAVALLALTGCGGSDNDALPLIRTQISVKTISADGACEVIPVRISPIALSGVANKYANNRMMVTDITMSGPTDENGAPMCTGTGESLPMAPGEWEFSAPLRSGPHSCKKQITGDGDLKVIFIDGIEGCSGVVPAAAVEQDTAGETGEMGEMGETGEAPAEEVPPAG